jgi:alpha-glucoside transport system substrate-binding protein
VRTLALAGLIVSTIAAPVFAADTMAEISAMKLSGQTINIYGPWTGPDEDNFRKVIGKFVDATGATVNYTGSQSFEQQIVVDVDSGSPPNIAIFPQPGLAATLAAKGALSPLGDDTAKWMKDNYAAGPSWVDLGTYKGKDGAPAFYGFPYKVDLKSLVWYVPDNFKDAGYQVPQTMEDLMALSAKMVADGHTPWCIGLGSGSATGWPGTDWVEEFMLRTQPPEVYDQWVKNEIKFDDPRVIAAIDLFGQFVHTDDWVYGGPKGVVTQTYKDIPKELFTVPPNCYLHRQASFITSFFPDNVVLGQDVDFFYFPAFASKPELGKPVEGGGTIFTITKDSPATRAFMDYLKTTDANEVWMGLSGFLTARKGVNLDAYANDTLRKEGQVVLNATTFRFDASDLMPGAVGAGSFWTGMVDYVGGKSAKDVAAAIQASWDAIK